MHLLWSISILLVFHGGMSQSGMAPVCERTNIGTYPRQQWWCSSDDTGQGPCEMRGHILLYTLMDSNLDHIICSSKYTKYVYIKQQESRFQEYTLKENYFLGSFICHTNAVPQVGGWWLVVCCWMWYPSGIKPITALVFQPAKMSFYPK